AGMPPFREATADGATGKEGVRAQPTPTGDGILERWTPCPAERARLRLRRRRAAAALARPRMELALARGGAHALYETARQRRHTQGLEVRSQMGAGLAGVSRTIEQHVGARRTAWRSHERATIHASVEWARWLSPCNRI